MVHLEHLNLVVRDIPSSVKFYLAAFPHWRIRQQGESQWNGKDRKWLHIGDDYQYLTLNDNGEGENRDLDGQQTGLAHFAYVVNSLDNVMERLAAAGFDKDHDGATEPFRKNVYYVDPNGFEVEFVEYLSDDPEERNRPS